MAANLRGCSSVKKQDSLIIATITLVVITTQIISIAALYVPDSQVTIQYTPIGRRQDSDEDELDRGASAPYQNQDGNQDGYEDKDPDGPYEETPRDEEGQADLERFFDDHLGASERDGMDKENLPSNVVPIVIQPNAVSGYNYDNNDNKNQQAIGSSAEFATSPSSNNGVVRNPNMISYLESSQVTPSIETRYMQLPNRKLIITRQITRGPVYKGGLDLSQVPSLIRINDQPQVTPKSDGLETKGSEIVATEDEDMDRIYVTRNTKKPFKIAALGGYDPEEDFQDASRDFEEPEKQNQSGDKKADNEVQQVKDISFTDPEADTLFNDASETDEVVFGHDPYQTDLEAELVGEQTQGPERQEQSESQANGETNNPRAEQQPIPKPQSSGNDDDEGGWVNDGVEDMDVPSQSYQDSVLEKAAKQEALARQATEPDSEARQQEAAEQADPDNQRMPNADYLKEDMKVDDPEDKSEDKYR